MLRAELSVEFSGFDVKCHRRLRRRREHKGIGSALLLSSRKPGFTMYSVRRFRVWVFGESTKAANTKAGQGEHTGRVPVGCGFLLLQSLGLGFRVQGLGFRVWGSGFRVQGSGFRVQGLGFRDEGSGFGVQGSGFRVWGLGFGVSGLGFRFQVSGCRVQGLAFRSQVEGFRVQGLRCRVQGSGFRV